jgi:pSer/pThr/pTyr-binding forkhead associated (FHA) protein/chromosome segregation ATPase
VARLQILNGKREGELLDLEAGTHRIGTGRAEIQLRDKEIAYKHANLIVEATTLAVEDLGSGKGVFVNGTRLAEKAKTDLKGLDRIQVGATELLVVQVDGQPAAIPDAGKTAPNVVVLFEEDEETGELVEKAPGEVEAEPEPTPEPAPPPAARVAQPVVEPVLTGKQTGDVEKLEAELAEMKARLARSDQENSALKKALDHLHDSDEAKAPAYVTADLESDLEGRNVELQDQADKLQVELIELQKANKDSETEHARALEKLQAELAAEKKKRSAVEREVQRLLEAKEGAATDDKKRKAELGSYEDANAQLVLENDELKERVEALKFTIEQEAARRGELIRERVMDLTAENHRLEESNAELRTLVEAYEEKIDELDERLEELEGENEQFNKILEETRAELQKTKNERETMQKTLRQTVQRLEARVDELEAEKLRLRSQAENKARVETSPANPAEELEQQRAKVARLEALLDDVEAIEQARNAEARARELEAELAGLRVRLESEPKPTDDLAAALAQARSRVEELEKRARIDEKKIERLERKNRELVRANIAAEIAQKRE